MADITLSIGVSIVDVFFGGAIVVADENPYSAKVLGCNRVVSGLLHTPPTFA